MKPLMIVVQAAGAAIALYFALMVSGVVPYSVGKLSIRVVYRSWVETFFIYGMVMRNILQMCACSAFVCHRRAGSRAAELTTGNDMGARRGPRVPCAWVHGHRRWTSICNPLLGALFLYVFKSYYEYTCTSICILRDVTVSVNIHW